MCIGIDGRYIQDHFPGIGRCTYSLIETLARLPSPDTYCLAITTTCFLITLSAQEN